ncbi:glycerophosphodiester phosphodiesterase GDPDL6 [Medicago truncatula]|nr:glycerophosphodiester phosphodiesterase GDPDL6 [Medicago truncatula]AES92567.2 glycerophosphoryl diester phosphodiesterase family protein [Medicago truncatula]
MLRRLFLFSFLLHSTLAQKPAVPHHHPIAPHQPVVPNPIPVKKWSTLSGNEPLVIARGGFSGLFPEGTEKAIELSQDISIFLCNLQLTNDGGAFCVTGATLDNSTTIEMFDPKQKTYNINGRDVQGHFSTDYSGVQIENDVKMTQAIFSRPDFFDGVFPVANVDALLSTKTPPKFWLNVQNAGFYTQYGKKAVEVVLEILRALPVDFVSSPDIGFLKSIARQPNKATKVVFQLLNAMDVEPQTKQPYGIIIKDLVAIKSFASGIMVPKEFILPVKPDKYLGLPTTLVADAHKLGLEVYASGFANDLFSSYSYNYDPTAEYLQFIDSRDSVDGVVTDFPTTASNAIGCFAHNNTLPKKGPTLIISSNGSSGVYPGSTDLAYQQAITDGADIIDCSVQMTKDGIAFCANTIDLLEISTALPKFMARSSSVPELQPKNGIFSFDLTWTEIQTLKPQMVNPFGNEFQRNPANKNNGKFVTLPEFLDLAKTKAVFGILIHIQNAAYLASKKGLDIVGAVTAALSNATFDKQATQQVFIQSDDSSVLSKFKDIPSYKRVLLIENIIDDIPVQTVEEIKKYAEVVNIPKLDVIKGSNSLLIGLTNVVKELKGANLTVFVHILKNEYLSLAFDFWSDPNVEIATYMELVDGIVTEFPATAYRFMKSPCSDPNHGLAILPAHPGDLLTMAPDLLKPKDEPPRTLQVADVVDPPLPPVINLAKAEPPAAPTPPPPASGVRAYGANSVISLVAVLVVEMFYAGH